MRVLALALLVVLCACESPESCDSCFLPVCGNGEVEPGEICDDGNTIDGDSCEATCRPAECGNGIVDEGEVCDDANQLDGDGCRHDCIVSTCGTQQTGEVCLEDGDLIALPGSSGGALTSADFDGDGDLDLIVPQSSFSDNYLTLIENVGGRMVPRRSFRTVGPGGRPIAIDWDGDGDLDLVTLCSVDSGLVVQKLANEGNAWFRSASVSAIASPPSSGTLAVGDFNVDGRLDVAIAGRDGVWVAHDDGAGGYELGARLSGGGDHCCIVALDFDGDGDSDLSFAGYSTISHYRNDGGTLTSIGTSGTTRPSDLAVGDIDGDGDLDEVAFSGAPVAFDIVTVNVLRNDGGQFVQAAFADDIAAGAGTLGDVDGDGDLDVIYATDTSIVTLTNDGTGALVGRSVQEGIYQPADLIAADLDGDTHADVALGKDGALAIYRGAPALDLRHSYAVGDNPRGVALGDLTGDGRPELVTANDFGRSLTVYRNDGAGGLGAASTIIVGRNPQSVVVADLDGDGDRDLLVTLSAFGVKLLRNDGLGQFPVQETLGPATASGVAAADLDGDAIVDLVFGSPMSVYRGTGGGAFSLLATYPFASGSDVILVDVDGDGDRDVVVVGSSILIALNDGAGQLTMVDTEGTSHLAQVAVADVDGDSAPDLVAAGEPTVVFRNGGGGMFTKFQELALLGDGAAIADLDGDGAAELLLSSERERRLRVFARAADGTFTLRALLAAPEGDRLVVGDLDGDGRADLAGTNPFVSSASVWRSRP